MEYKKISRENYNLHLIKNDRFKTVNVDIYFSSVFNKENIPFINLLVKLLVYSTKKYNTKNKIATVSEDLYNASISTGYIAVGNLQGFLVSLGFINPMFTEETMYEESFKFLKEVIFNPNVKDNAFDEETFNLLKTNFIREIDSMRDRPNIISYENYKKIMHMGTSAEYSLLGTSKDYDKLNSRNLYTFYKKLLHTSKIDILIMGDVDEDKVIELTDKMFKNNATEYQKLETLFINEKTKDKPAIKTEPYKFNQSILHMGYKFKDLTEYEIKYVLPIYNVILGSMNNSVLFVNVREKNSYCYSISSAVSKFSKSLTITSGINRKNYKNVVSEIKLCMKLMNDEKFISKQFGTAIKTVNTYLNDYYDNIYSILEHYFINEFESEEDVEKRREEYNKMKPSDITSLNKKMVLDTIYFMEGVNDENN